jgi:hypothetical protein
MNELREMMRVEDDLLEPSSFAFRDVHVPLMAHLKRYTIKKKNTQRSFKK